MIELLGILSGGLTTLCWVPQLLRTRRRGTSDDISGTYLFTLATGVTGWVVYGVLRADIAVILANAVTLVLLICLAGMKYGRRAAPFDLPAPSDSPSPEPAPAVAAALRRGSPSPPEIAERGGWGW